MQILISTVIKAMDKKTYKKYKRRIAQAVAKVDNKPPRFEVSAYYKPHNMRSDINRIREIDKQNIKLLRRMNIITRLRSNIDCWLPKIKYKSKLDNQEVKNTQVMKENKNLLRKIRRASTNYSTAEFIQDWKEMNMKMEHNRRYQKEPTTHTIGLQSPQDHCIITDLSLLKHINPSIRTKCFFEIEIQGDQKLGSIHFELYDDIVPRTCTNFAELCRGYNGLSYKNTPFHRIVSGYWCQGGDVTKLNGCGGKSIYGESFEHENYNLRHAGPGILSMCNETENTCNSKFNLTFRQLETVDGKNVVFGKVIAGLSNIYKIEEFGTKTGKPFKTIIISNCGIISRYIKNK
ncbi:E3 SUMO-protein ligase RanBP2-like isoform X1 [Bombus vosnesenskii]|uniref:peptidylprolyl isomerase n=2 Tax=Bombus vosnesenskii TaxID=207650 RepID=A0A6J3KND3_9HYME|nr:E3 SUMO-protein ligase RanBP2-like isoform X1 [Bombus vosnesenskii]